MDKTVKINVITHRKTGLLVARSDDLPGLMVHGRSDEELDERIPDAIRALMEAQGERVADVIKVGDEPETAFRPASAEYAAELCPA
jgi:hypothetical protein